MKVEWREQHAAQYRESLVLYKVGWTSRQEAGTKWAFTSSLPSKFIPGRTTAGAGVGADANDLYDDWN
jgi:hypothetical protein